MTTETTNLIPTYGNQLILATYRENSKKLFREHYDQQQSFSKQLHDSRPLPVDKELLQRQYEHHTDKCYEYRDGQFKTVKDYADYYLELIELKYTEHKQPIPRVEFTDEMTKQAIDDLCYPILFNPLFDDK